jgi:PAS domain S-box-containing protein
MNESLHESTHFMTMLTDFMPGMVGYWTKELRSTFANREYLSWLGKSKEEVSGIAIQDLLGDELFRKHEPYIRAALSGESQAFDYTLLLPNDETRETLVHYIPHRDGNEVLGLFVLILDITERKSLEQALISAAEKRQRLIGQELHDNLGQQIAAIAYQAQALERKIIASGSEDTAKIAAAIAAQAQNAVVQCKHLARGLIPLELESSSLTDVMQAFAKSIALTYEITCSFVCTSETVIDDDNLALNLYRIAQEATHNAIDHGGAQHLTISLEAGKGEAGKGMLRLSICDDGCGFVGRDTKREAIPGLGIKIMQYRANQIGATLKLIPRAERGTEVLVERRAQ